MVNLVVLKVILVMLLTMNMMFLTKNCTLGIVETIQMILIDLYNLVWLHTGLNRSREIDGKVKMLISPVPTQAQPHLTFSQDF